MAALPRLGRRRARSPLAAEDNLAGWVFILPALVFFTLFTFYPIVRVFWISLHNWDLVTGRDTLEFIGLDNFDNIFTGPRSSDFYNALRNTIWYSAGVVPVQTAIALVLAVLANRKIRGKTFFRTAFYFPSISSSVVISIIFLWMFAQNGVVNFVLRELGLPTPRPIWLQNPKGLFEILLGPFGVDQLNPWLEGPSLALLVIMMLNIWTTCGTMMVIYLAGLQDIPNDVYEASALDGASRWRQFRDLTVPLIRPVTLFVLTIGLIGTFQVFDQIFVMTDSGGPAKKTQTLAYLIYLEAFEGFAMGYAAALAVVLFGIILVLFLVQRRLVGQSTQY
jgi:multiple sugar transport system permease protein